MSLDAVRRAFWSRRRIDLDTNFFEAGFSSAGLTEIVTELREQGHEVSLLDVYRHPTLRELARALEGAPPPGPAAPPWLS